MKNIYFLLFLSFLTDLCNIGFTQIPKDYKGKPFKPYPCFEGAQVIPGRVELAYYDEGGEGLAYHDNDSVNSGAELSYRPEHKPIGVSETVAFFRENEGVDITYTKHWVDFNHPNKVDPKVNQQYIGWQEDGEWTNYTIDVKIAGRCRIITLYSNYDNNSTLWLNNEFAIELELPESTGYWHNWNQATVGEISFPVAGLNLLTLKYNAGANLAYLDFVLIEEYK
jgi:hypothetical protein